MSVCVCVAYEDSTKWNEMENYEISVKKTDALSVNVIESTQFCTSNTDSFYFRSFVLCFDWWPAVTSHTLIVLTWSPHWKVELFPTNKSIFLIGTPNLSHFAVRLWRQHVAFGTPTWHTHTHTLSSLSLCVIKDTGTHIFTHSHNGAIILSAPICSSDCNLHLLLAFSLPEAVRREDGWSYTTSYWQTCTDAS